MKQTRLVTTWRKSFKFWTNRLAAFGATAVALWPTLPADTQQTILEFFGIKYPGALAVVGFLAIIVARNIKQKPTTPEEPTP